MAIDNMVIRNRMLVFHSAYTYEYLAKYGMEIFVQARDAGNYFDQILTVSPLATLQYETNNLNLFSKPSFHRLDDKNVILEGRIGRFEKLSRFPKINFLLAQFSLVFTILIHGKLSQVSIVRAEDPRINGIYGFLFSKLLRVPLIIGVWGNPGRLRKMNNQPLMPRLFPTAKREEQVENFILRRATMVLAQNAENMRYVLEAGVPLTKTMFTELGVGIDKNHFLPLEEREDVSFDATNWGLSEKFVLCCISRLEKSKMVDHAIKSLVLLKEHRVPFKMILIGDGRERVELEKLAEELGINENLIYAGNRSQSWIAGILKYVDVNVAPLCGRSLLEASLAGCPAVAYNLDWHSVIVHDGETGFLVPALNFTELGNKILELYQNPKLRYLMREKMKIEAVKFANPEMIAARQKSMYQKLSGK